MAQGLFLSYLPVVPARQPCSRLSPFTPCPSPLRCWLLARLPAWPAAFSCFCSASAPPTKPCATPTWTHTRGNVLSCPSAPHFSVTTFSPFPFPNSTFVLYYKK